MVSIISYRRSAFGGDLEQPYEIVEAFGLRVTVGDNIAQPGQVLWYLSRYLGGNVSMDDGCKAIKCATS
jgi:predicted phage gp36 major capsid-like protein